MARAFTTLAAAGVAAVAVALGPRFLPEAETTATAQSPPPAPKVEITEVETRALAETAEFLGRVEAKETVELRAQVAGYLDEVAFQDGELVEEGDLLFRIDPRPYEVALAQAEARVKETEARLEAAQAKFDRTSQLVERSIVSREHYDEAEAERESLAAQLEAAKTAVRAAELELSFTEVRAPISGRIGRANITRGNYVTAGAGKTPLARIMSVDPVHVTFDVDEASYLTFLAGELPLAANGPSALKVFVRLMGDAAFSHEGRVNFIDNRIDPTTGTVKVRAVLPNPDGRLAPGLFARVKLSFGPPQEMVLVDESAVGTNQSQRFVLVLDHENTLQFRPVELGQAVGEGKRVVTAGLKPGEEIMMKGMARPGMQVVPVPHETASIQAEAQENGEVDQ